ncbi:MULTISPECIES: alpha/beta hydrolase family protein [Cyanophyceae]|uniref:alpha/beta hydrolase family protein n=1 Tax=Cyanophyceae TaxID=3028117 RepID=UPI0028C428A0|nr:chlorophyllase [Trichocoleus sp. FACHB-69]
MVAFGATFITLGTAASAIATTFSAEPLFKEVNSYTTTIATNGDPADIYFPFLPDADTNTNLFPVVLLLQGALVDKADYSNFATIVASYGFVVVVPNNERTLVAPTGQSVTGFFPEQQQVNDVLAYMVAEDSNPDSPVADLVDTSKLALLGHSFGGAVGLASLQDLCVPFICSGSFEQPEELVAGIFYGTNFRDPPEVGVVPPIANGGIPIGLIAGSRDGVASPSVTEETYNQIQDQPKVLITVEGANHYGITNEDNLLRDPIRPTLDQAVATETIARWSALFLMAQVVDNQSAFDYVYNTGDALDENVSVVSQAKPVPEATSGLGVLLFGTFCAGSIVKRLLSKG